MQRPRLENPIVELDGDEMARVMWGWIKEDLIRPHIDLQIDYYDLGIRSRDASDDRVTREAAEAIRREGVGVKCAAINPDGARVQEFNLKQAWKSPNAQVRNIVGGTLFREPIPCGNIPRRIPHWKRPVIVARHAFGDQFAAADLRVPGPGRLTLRFEPAGGGAPIEEAVYDFPSAGIALGMYNLDESIRDFARAAMRFALERGLPLLLGTKNTALKTYDQRFVTLFADVYESEFAAAFEAQGLVYEHRLVDELAAHVIKSEGGFVWACKNHDGDVQSDVVAEAYGSLGLMASMLVSGDGRTVQTEAAHGTITRHFREHQAGRETSTNPVASIVAWARAIGYRARLDDNPPALAFARSLEQACVQTIEAGSMTRDLARLATEPVEPLTTRAFIAAVRHRLEAA